MAPSLHAESLTLRGKLSAQGAAAQGVHAFRVTPYPAREGGERLTDAVLLQQVELVRRCREWSRGPAGLRTPCMPDGTPLSIRSVCLGWHWYPYYFVWFAKTCQKITQNILQV